MAVNSPLPVAANLYPINGVEISAASLDYNKTPAK